MKIIMNNEEKDAIALILLTLGLLFGLPCVVGIIVGIYQVIQDLLK